MTIVAVEYHPKIKDLPLDSRPRERLREHGPGALSNAELLAIILRTGIGGTDPASKENVIEMAQRLLARYRGLGGLFRASFADLCNEHGLGPAKAAQLKAAFELGRRLVVEQPEERATVRSPADVANLLQLEMAMLAQECLRVVLLDTKNRVLSMRQVYQGSVNTSQVRVAEVFRDAVNQNAPALVVVHNHPSGDPTPSPEDVRVTEALIQAGKLLDIEVLDHLVIGQQRFVSLRERGLAFR
ncbi:MAG: DNA repair protein RadC [Chloroflexi bacterium]|nr:DNA repair protein RadC [Chloroflexota bacterium]